MPAGLSISDLAIDLLGQGKTVKPPASNSHGVSNELDISVSGDGSWVAGSVLGTYVPTTTSAGSINISKGAELRLEIQGPPGAAFTATFNLDDKYAPSNFHVSDAPITVNGVSMEQVTLTTTHA